MSSRRSFLKGAVAATVAPALVSCDARSPERRQVGQTRPANPPAPGEFDYPYCLPLPFAHGVASGDPLHNSIILWTRITEEVPSASSHDIDWVIGTSFDAVTETVTGVINFGTQRTSASRDWTVKVDAGSVINVGNGQLPLQAETTYYYQFSGTLGGVSYTSIIGRTRTAPNSTRDLKIAVASCSSLWSSYWSGYDNLAAREDIDLVIHAGDYIYDFVDADEEVRARRNIKDIQYVDYRNWRNLEECRRRHALYRSDPANNRAHQQCAWVIAWDNHDVASGGGNELSLDTSDPNLPPLTVTASEVLQAFHEWTPTRAAMADGSLQTFGLDGNNHNEYVFPSDVRYQYRMLEYGPLADILVMDQQYIGREDGDTSDDNSHLASGGSLLTDTQFHWFTQTMRDSQQVRSKTWRLVVSQTWIAPWNIPNVVPGVSPGGTPVETRWNDFEEERAALFEYLRGAYTHPSDGTLDNATRIRNNIFLSGDMHGNWGSDVIESNALTTAYQPGPVMQQTGRNGSTPENVNAGYGRASTNNTIAFNNRADSVGAEFAPTSMGRGGADELEKNANPGSSVASQVAAARAVELATIQGNKNVQYMEWVDHGYGVVHLSADKAEFDFIWQDKLTPDSPDVLGNKMVAWSATDTTNVPFPKQQDQIDNASLFGITVPTVPEEGTSLGGLAPNTPREMSGGY